MQGTSTFATDYASREPRDREGRPLREFDLERRLFRYPCSYVIQGEAFRGLPAPVRDIVLLRLLRILTSSSGRRAYAYLSEAERRAILQILADTVPDLPEAWRTAAARRD